MAILVGIVAARSYNGTKFRTKGRKHIEMDHVFNGTFWADSRAIHWVPEGVYHIYYGLGCCIHAGYQLCITYCLRGHWVDP